MLSMCLQRKGNFRHGILEYFYKKHNILTWWCRPMFWCETFVHIIIIWWAHMQTLADEQRERWKAWMGVAVNQIKFRDMIELQLSLCGMWWENHLYNLLNEYETLLSQISTLSSLSWKAFCSGWGLEGGFGGDIQEESSVQLHVISCLDLVL